MRSSTGRDRQLAGRKLRKALAHPIAWVSGVDGRAAGLQYRLIEIHSPYRMASSHIE
jgi:hypothetical protein